MKQMVTYRKHTTTLSFFETLQANRTIIRSSCGGVTEHGEVVLHAGVVAAATAAVGDRPGDEEVE
ncbi:hypothetical protein HanRHA438_Chr09g0383171 [Helianthus annuus]|nr:hypothetical protein HanRHA438_Chr09g0383171 [Helianthus annuus]